MTTIKQRKAELEREIEKLEESLKKINLITGNTLSSECIATIINLMKYEAELKGITSTEAEMLKESKKDAKYFNHIIAVKDKEIEKLKSQLTGGTK